MSTFRDALGSSEGERRLVSRLEAEAGMLFRALAFSGTTPLQQVDYGAPAETLIWSIIKETIEARGKRAELLLQRLGEDCSIPNQGIVLPSFFESAKTGLKSE